MNTLWIAVLVVCTGYVQAQVPPNLTCFSPRPFMPTCLDKYAAFPGHLNCEQRGLTGRPLQLNDTEQEKIADLHNEIRSQVSPRAADMIKQKNNPGFASTAERFARRCTADSTWYQRATPGGYILGQNHLYSDKLLNWTNVVGTWESEKAHFAYNSTANNPSLIGNYTQMISAEASSLGCGAAQCSGFYLYICLYASILDPAKINQPYKQSASNTSCDDCSGHCSSTSARLCDYGGLICLSGSKLNMTTYRCDCISTVRPGTYNDSVCFLNCVGTNDSDPECSISLNGTCGSNLKTMFRCPWMCNVCPYSDRNWNVTLISKMPWEKGLPDCTTTPPPTTPTTTLPIQTSTSTLAVSQFSLTTAGHPLANAQQKNGGMKVAFSSVLLGVLMSVTQWKQLII